MWLSKKAVKREDAAAAQSSVGEVTIGGASPGALTDAEHRGLLLASPGGYFWRPRAGENVLVIKGADGSAVAAGAIQEAPAELSDGEICLRAGECEIWLTKDAGVVIRGSVTIEGSLFVRGSVTENFGLGQSEGGS